MKKFCIFRESEKKKFSQECIFTDQGIFFILREFIFADWQAIHEIRKISSRKNFFV